MANVDVNTMQGISREVDPACRMHQTAAAAAASSSSSSSSSRHASPGLGFQHRYFVSNITENQFYFLLLEFRTRKLVKRVTSGETSSQY
jgi:hypothetical protein